ncbi:Hypothetical predicted protein [Scomber scombrus]|uniref:Uncharacterized protein n=1 Tax=Scomber scombrus TaxID=13677 RepID=A0AAV1PRE6_SCOSC
MLKPDDQKITWITSHEGVWLMLKPDDQKITWITSHEGINLPRFSSLTVGLYGFSTLLACDGLVTCWSPSLAELMRAVPLPTSVN